MTVATIPARADARVQLAKQRGYLVTIQARGCSAWLDECRLRRWPFVVVIRDGRRWRFRVEMEGWRFTDFGQRAMTFLLAEHDATHVMVGVDHAYGYRLHLWQAELIASAVMRWVFEAIADQKAEAQL